MSYWGALVEGFLTALLGDRVDQSAQRVREEERERERLEGRRAKRHAKRIRRKQRRSLRYRGSAMARPKIEDDATKKLKLEDETQEARQGTKIGRLSREKMMADFRKIARAKRRQSRL